MNGRLPWWVGWLPIPAAPGPRDRRGPHAASLPGERQRDGGNAADRAVPIRKGAKPAEVQGGRATRFDLVFDGRTARSLGVTTPRALVLRADEVIE
jgi:ABC-type uncharacterized transport system substrate-binding protein